MKTKTAKATATAHPNIALIKYWGDFDSNLHIPVNGSISMNLRELFTRTSVSFDPYLGHDQFTLDGRQVSGSGLERVSSLLERVRQMAGITISASVESHNNFPTGSGVASSASGFAALSLAASKATGLDLDEKSLSRLARTGSGSACRSILKGFVEWQAGSSDQESYAYSIAPPEHWDLVDCIVLVSQDEKPFSSSLGHTLAQTSLLQSVRVADAPRRLRICRNAIFNSDFDALANVVELDSNLMHAVMLTSSPSLLYWHPNTVTIMQAVQSWHKAGLPVCYTIDAGPNVHVLCPGDVSGEVAERLKQLSGVVKVLVTHPGGPAMLENGPLNP
jgi:diphosphomevalonate decarboxylase